ncbi:MAG: BamA/TamA family outer membrane protein [Candidatus Eisenbacteria bacterium]|nr:BamA/TamA family outer membrane protein [Candidatus Eisenbacteria bacterium]
MRWEKRIASQVITWLASLFPAAALLVLVAALHVPPAAAEKPAPEGGFSFLPLPVLFYTPETHLGGGAALLVIHRPEDRPEAHRPSQIAVLLVHTEKKQTQIVVKADLFLREDDWRFLAEAQYENYPDLFYGIGRNSRAEEEETYTQRGPTVLFGVRRRLAEGLYAGPRFSFMDVDVRDAEEGGAIAEGAVDGGGGAKTATIGFGFGWDRRNHPFLPDGGFLLQGTADFGDRRTGSDFAYNAFALDGRAFFPGFGGDHSIGAHLLFEASTGSPPFQLLYGLGDESILRGYHGRRYVDRMKAALQAEYRLPLTGRLGAVLYGGAGDVVRDPGDFKRSKFKHGFGFGFRYDVKPEERLRLRLDIAYGADESGVYVNFGEAF